MRALRGAHLIFPTSAIVLTSIPREWDEDWRRTRVEIEFLELPLQHPPSHFLISTTASDHINHLN